MLPWRVKTLLINYALIALLVIARLFYWQIIQGGRLSAQAESQYFNEREIPVERGIIYSSDNYPLVINQTTYSLFGMPKNINIPLVDFSKKIENILVREGVLGDEIINKLSETRSNWILLSKGLTEDEKDKITNLKLEGLGFENDEKRKYPEGSMSAQLLGFLGKDSVGNNKGYFGLEGFYDRELKGKSGIIRQEKDAHGSLIPIGQTSVENEIPGRDLTLFLDRRVQFVCETKLKEGMNKYGAVAGSVIVIDPQTGGIIASASYPNYDPANYSQQDNSLFSNPVVSQNFEPGSIFKVLVMASALNEKVIKPEDTCDKCSGPRVIGEYSIQTWDNKYHPDSTIAEILKNSDNVGMVYIADKLGKDKMYKYLDNFGIGKMTGIDLEGEAAVALRPKDKWGEIDMATMSFGQGVVVTPVQMVVAVSAIANGGKLMEPHVVKNISAQGKEIEIQPKIVRKILDESSTKIMTEIMINAVKSGEAKWAAPKGYRIAGKTGTAQIPLAGYYDKEKTIASFIGFAPADNPKFVMLVTLREPTTSPWGSETAAPLWFGIAKDIFNLWGIAPSS